MLCWNEEFLLRNEWYPMNGSKKRILFQWLFVRQRNGMELEDWIVVATTTNKATTTNGGREVLVTSNTTNNSTKGCDNTKGFGAYSNGWPKIL